MKRIFIFAIVAISFSACKNANTKQAEGTHTVVDNTGKTAASVAPEDAPKIVFERDVYDFGKIVTGEKVQHDFKFKNEGKSPLIISDATATCGCTVPEIPKEPILPGAEATLKVVFDSTNKTGLQDKVITITSNAVPTQTTVHIIGDVLEKK